MLIDSFKTLQWFTRKSSELYHPNFKTLIERIYNPQEMKGLIAFGENKEVFSIGSEEFFQIFNDFLKDVEGNNYNVSKKKISDEEFKEIHESFDLIDNIALDRILLILEKIEERLDILEDFLKEKLGSNYQKIKHLVEKYRRNELTKRELITKGANIIGKSFIKIWLFFNWENMI